MYSTTNTLRVFSFFQPALLVVVLMLSLASCGGDDDPVVTQEECDNVTTIDGSLTLDGQEQNLTVALFMANSPGSSFDDRYSFTIASINSDCTELTTVSLNIDVAQGDTFGGTYNITDFFDAEAGDAYGNVMKQKYDPVSISSFDLESGTATVVNNGNNNFTLTIDATLVGGASLDFEMTHGF